MTKKYQLLPLFSFAFIFVSCTMFRSKPDRLSPDASEARFKEGAELLFNDNQQALEKFEMAFKISPNFIAAYYNAGLANEALGNDEAAIKNYEDCLLHNKEQSSCLDNLLILKHKLGQDRSAEELINNYLQAFKDQSFAHEAAAKFFLAKNDLMRAEKQAREAIELDADNVEALFVMARVYYQQKKYPAAKWVIKNALEIAPSHGQLYLLLGHIYIALQLYHDALDAYKSAVKFFPTEEALECYGLILLGMGKVSDGLSVLKKLSELKPKNFRHQIHLGNAYMANKMYFDAKIAYLKALELNPKDNNVFFNLGLLFFEYKPSDLRDLEQYRLSLSNFQKYLDQPGLSKERLEEVMRYIKLLKQKIEAEESAAS